MLTQGNLRILRMPRLGYPLPVGPLPVARFAPYFYCNESEGVNVFFVLAW